MPLPPDKKALGLWLLAAAMASLIWMLPRIPQPLQYHQFADRHACFGMTGCFDIASNALFVLSGLAGLLFLSGETGRRAFIDKREALPYRLFFLAATLVGLGSGYYHLAPDNSRLVWDRAAISLALMSLFAAILCERVSLSAGLRLLPLLFAAGLGSVGYWGWSEMRGSGDLRAYGLMQLYPLLLIPLLLLLYPPRYSGDKDIMAVIGLYLLALLYDLTDHQIAALTGVVSGHTTKHIIAALAIYWVVVRLKRRRILQASVESGLP
ncbi:MAG TPA: alkaline phytoceramidase [Gallionella sp.]|nr:alkaline phytoceramidase [Gallionella sp.]